jgi:hypothetical protein
MYENLNEYETFLANFADRVGIIASMEISGKITQEDAHQQVKELYKQLKRLRKQTM